MDEDEDEDENDKEKEDDHLQGPAVILRLHGGELKGLQDASPPAPVSPPAPPAGPAPAPAAPGLLLHTDPALSLCTSSTS